MALAGGVVCADARAELAVLGVQYQADKPFPEHECFWNSSQLPGPCGPSSPLGASIHVFLRNTSSSPVTVQDVVFAGFSLEQVLALHYQVEKRQPASIWLAGLTSTELQTLVNAGEPVWYKTDPGTIAAGGVAQVVVRLRQTPQVPSLDVEVVHSEGTTSVVVPVQPAQPALAGATVSSNLNKVCLYWRRTPAGDAPAAILLDGTNVTPSTTTVSDPSVDLAVSVVQLSQPLTPGSMHVFQGVYGDGQMAGGAVRAWNNEFIYATWGARAGASGDTNAARAWIDEAANHFVNALEVQGGSDAVKEYLKTPDGKQYAAEHGYGCVIDTVGLWGCTNPLMWFIRDEPDAADSRVTDLPSGKMVGSLAQMAVQTGEALRAAYPAAPTTINIDGTYKPFNWYNYGQVADVMMTDPYYQNRLREALWSYPERIPLYSKATYIYAVSQLAQSAAEPNPLHVILYSCEYKDGSGQVFPFAPPETKRIEVYYALAAGAKGMAYWWFLPGSPANGLGAATPAANALWREIGVLGAEIRTAAPLLLASWPASVPLQPSSGVWVRSLLAGNDSLVLLVVDDQYANDEAGCHYTNVPNATVTVTLPSWLPSPAAFEIAASGLSDVSTQPNGSQLQVNLGTLALTRMIVLTTNPQLRAAIQQRYDQLVRPGLCVLAPELCVNHPPSITQQPANQTIAPGESASFSVVASGTSPLSYQWQENLADLSDGGHYAGCTTATLIISNADSIDAASYRCIVTNAYGSATSSVATLAVVTTTNPPSITQHPVNATVPLGGSATFSVMASGTSPLGYQWQKNQANLANGGHYAGCTTTNLTISDVDSNDLAGYRCVVTNAYGRATSSVATLSLPPVCPGVSLLNGSFEEGNTGGLADGWTAYQRAPYPTNTTWTIQTASPPPGGGLQYQQIANSSSAGGAGVRQDVTGCTIGATYTVSGWMRGNSTANATCRVKVSPTASADWATAIDLIPAQSYTGPTWIPFSGTVKATGTAMTIWLDGQTGGTGQFKAECFDSVTVTCTTMPVPLRFEPGTGLSEGQVRLVLSGEPGTSVTIHRSEDLVNWSPLTNLMNTTGSLEFTDQTATNAPQRFYRATQP